MKKEPKSKQYVRSGGGIYALNQHAPRYAHRATKRNRSRSDQRRNAFSDQEK
jgi:hypothetical protein